MTGFYYFYGGIRYRSAVTSSKLSKKRSLSNQTIQQQTITPRNINPFESILPSQYHLLWVHLVEYSSWTDFSKILGLQILDSPTLPGKTKHKPTQTYNKNYRLQHFAPKKSTMPSISITDGRPAASNHNNRVGDSGSSGRKKGKQGGEKMLNFFQKKGQTTPDISRGYGDRKDKEDHGGDREEGQFCSKRKINHI